MYRLRVVPDASSVDAVSLTHVRFMFPLISTVRVLSSYDVSVSSPVAL